MHVTKPPENHPSAAANQSEGSQARNIIESPACNEGWRALDYALHHKQVQQSDVTVGPREVRAPIMVGQIDPLSKAPIHQCATVDGPLAR
jgi:hypothetical protein